MQYHFRPTLLHDLVFLCLRVAIFLCLALAAANAFGQQREALPEIVPITEKDFLICETDRDLKTANIAQSGVSVVRQNATNRLLTRQITQRRLTSRRVLFAELSSMDRNRDGRLEHSELKVADPGHRREWLLSLDKNFDRQLNVQELAVLRQQVDEQESPQTESLAPYPTRPVAQTPRQAPTRQVLRSVPRFGVGLRPQPATSQSRSFARAATFGNTANFFGIAQPQASGNAGGGTIFVSSGGGRCE